MQTRLVLAAALLLGAIAPATAAEVRLHALLDGASVVSATDSKATGEATAVLDDDNRLRLDLVFGGLDTGVTGAGLHVGTAAENGPEAEPLDVRKTQTEGSLVQARFTLTDDVAARMRAGETYISIETVDHPAGAIRGQLVPQPVRLDYTP